MCICMYIYVHMCNRHPVFWAVAPASANATAAAATGAAAAAAASAAATTIANKMCCNKRIRMHRSRSSGATNLVRYGCLWSITYLP